MFGGTPGRRIAARGAEHRAGPRTRCHGCNTAVAAGKLTKDQEQSILTDLKQHITDLVNGVAPHGLRADHELGGGPPAI